MPKNLYNTKFTIANMTKIVANDNQLHNDWLQMTGFLIVIEISTINEIFLINILKLIFGVRFQTFNYYIKYFI